MADDDCNEVENDDSLAPACYFDQAPLDELRRYVCLDMARLGGSMPDKMVRLARDMERFLMGRGALRAADDHE